MADLQSTNQLSHLGADGLLPEIAGLVTTQSYAPKAIIQGVELSPLRIAVDAGGSFMETARIDAEGRLEAFAHLDFRVRQANYSEMEPGAIKAWHLHFHQEDAWFVPPRDRLLVGLWDLRAGSPTAGLKMRLMLGAGLARLLYIPRGVAHGVANLTQNRCQIWYFVNQQFDPDNPDEHRLPWDAAGDSFWQMDRG